MNAVQRHVRSENAEHAPCQVAATKGYADDETLIAQSRREPERFAALYERYFADIYQYLAGRLGLDAADDLAADTFLDALRARDRFDPERGAVRPWLFGIATNLVRQHRRAEVRRYRALARAGGEPTAVGDEDVIAARVSAQQLRGSLAAAMAGLKDGDRDVLLLTAVAGLSYAEVAAALSIPPGTVGSRLNRARREVRAALGPGEPGPDGHVETTR